MLGYRSNETQPLSFLGLLTVGPASGREFTSSDGAKTLEAEFVRYSKKDDQVTLRLANGRNLVTGATFFSQQDRDFFEAQAREAALEQALKVDAKEHSDRENVNTGQMRIRREKVEFTFEIENVSDYNMDNLRVKYWVVVQYDNQQQPKIYEGSELISTLEARSTSNLKGPGFTLTLGAVSTCDCPKVKEAAAKIGRDRVVGERIEILAADGRLLYENSSSSKVDKALEKR